MRGEAVTDAAVYSVVLQIPLEGEPLAVLPAIVLVLPGSQKHCLAAWCCKLGLAGG